jgi:hypothetical protein
MSTPLINVQLSETHPDYQKVNFRRLPGRDNYVIVIVNLEKLIHYSDLNPHSSEIAPPVEDWPESERLRAHAFLAPPKALEREIEMPVVSFNESIGVSGVVHHVGYTKGRHRTRYLHFAGAVEIPVLCQLNQAEALQQYCGSNHRKLVAD